MKIETFNLCLEFHQALIRPRLCDEVKENAKRILVDGVDVKNASGKRLADKVNLRWAQIKLFADASFDKKVEVYTIATGRKANPQVFKALKEYESEQYKNMHQASFVNGVSMQCVKSLKERFDRFEMYANKL